MFFKFREEFRAVLRVYTGIRGYCLVGCKRFMLGTERSAGFCSGFLFFVFLFFE